MRVQERHSTCFCCRRAAATTAVIHNSLAVPWQRQAAISTRHSRQAASAASSTSPCSAPPPVPSPLPPSPPAHSPPSHRPTSTVCSCSCALWRQCRRRWRLFGSPCYSASATRSTCRRSSGPPSSAQVRHSGLPLPSRSACVRCSVRDWGRPCCRAAPSAPGRMQGRRHAACASGPPAPDLAIALCVPPCGRL
jgi:hypothetical protein